MPHAGRDLYFVCLGPTLEVRQIWVRYSSAPEAMCLERRIRDPEVVGSNPAIPTI